MTCMPAQVDTERLRAVLYSPLISGTHGDISHRFAALGIAEPEQSSQGTKAERVSGALAHLTDDELAGVASRLLGASAVSADLRNVLQDLLWAGEPPLIEERTRREISVALDLDDLIVDVDRFEALLDRWWVLGTPSPFEEWLPARESAVSTPLDGVFPRPDKLRREIRRHVLRNRDWDTELLLDQLGAFTAVDRRFAGFVEDLVSHQSLVHEHHQRSVVDAIAPILKRAQLELRETDTDGGYPVFRLVPIGCRGTGPKNVIFGSTRKPDLRLSNSVDNDIEIIDNGADVLVFNQPIDATTGLRWRDLHTWWINRQQNQDGDPHHTLYRRLRNSIPRQSPPQRLLFDLYHRIHGNRCWDLPALLPEVWLHWDHQTVAQRGAQALLGQRMDFLLLGPRHVRIVLEVDGVTHYTDPKGQPSPAVYARHTRLDRLMRLRGDDVYRFGGGDLQDEADGATLLTEFFSTLFQRHGISA